MAKKLISSKTASHSEQNRSTMNVVAFFNAYTEGVAGGDIRFIEIMERLNKKGIDLTVVTSLTGKELCVERRLNGTYKITTKERNPMNVFLLYFKRILSALSLRIEIRKETILYSTSDFLPDTLPAFIWKLRNRKAKWFVCIFLVVPNLFKDYTQSFVKGTRISPPTFSRLFYFLSQQLTIFLAKRWADQILVLNNMDKEFIRARGSQVSKVTVVNGGVDYNHIVNIETNNSLYDGVFVGRFHRQKGILDLIQIWKIVCNSKPSAKLCIIGNGQTSLVEEVKATIEENGLFDNIELVGSKIGDEKFSLLKSSKIFLCPSYYESFAIVIAEAMACGLPVIAYDLPIYEDIYGENIVRVSLGNIHQFADVILTFLKDDNLRKSFGLGGRKFIERYDWDKIAEKEYQLMIDTNEKR
jgi:glycosyltransferase involved in cell wall biosynthesis